jgi:L-fuconolactonase
VLKIDSHNHFWQYHPVKDAWITDDMKIIKCDFMPNDMQPLLAENAIDGCVAVQASQSEAETNFLLTLAENNSFIKGIVGWVDLSNSNCAQRLEHFTQYKKIKGFRHIVQAEPDGFMLNEKFCNGINALQNFGFTYDILIRQHQLKEAIDFVKKFPEQHFVIDHIGKPDIKNASIADWAKNITEIARQPNVYCKVSGMVTEADWYYWKPDDLKDYLDTVVNAFGMQRLMFGSDWPVCLLATTYTQWCRILQGYFQQFSVEEQSMFWGGNTTKFYNL